MNIFEALETLHKNNIIAYMDKGYKRQNENTPSSGFKRDTSFLPIPEPTVTSNGGVTLKYAVKGHVGDAEETHFNTISIIKNCEFYHTKFIIADECVEKVKELGMKVDGNVLNLEQFPIERKEVDLKVLFTNACNTYAAKLANYKPRGTYNRTAKPTTVEKETIKMDVPKMPFVKISIKKCSGKPRLVDINEKIAKGKKLSFAENILNEIDKHGLKFYDMTKQVNMDKFNLLMERKPFTKEMSTIINGITFEGKISME